jgi:hypothetical protein
MIHFLYLVGFALLVSIAFAVFTNGDNREKFISGFKNVRTVFGGEFGSRVDILFFTMVIRSNTKWV